MSKVVGDRDGILFRLKKAWKIVKADFRPLIDRIVMKDEGRASGVNISVKRAGGVVSPIERFRRLEAIRNISHE